MEEEYSEEQVKGLKIAKGMASRRENFYKQKKEFEKHQYEKQHPIRTAIRENVLRKTALANVSIKKYLAKTPKKVNVQIPRATLRFRRYSREEIEARRPRSVFFSK
jgi:hypothetical protein